MIKARTTGKDFQCPECGAPPRKECPPFAGWHRGKDHPQREALTKICPECKAGVGALCPLTNAPAWQKVHYRRMPGLYHCPQCCETNPGYRVPVLRLQRFPARKGPMPLAVSCVHCRYTLALLPARPDLEARNFPAGDAG